MTNVKTYLTLWFNSEGRGPSEVVQILNKIGFKEVHGNYDMEYSWDSDASVEELLQLADIVQKTLEGSNILFKMETI